MPVGVDRHNVIAEVGRWSPCLGYLRGGRLAGPKQPSRARAAVEDCVGPKRAAQHESPRRMTPGSHSSGARAQKNT